MMRRPVPIRIAGNATNIAGRCESGGVNQANGDDGLGRPVTPGVGEGMIMMNSGKASRYRRMLTLTVSAAALVPIVAEAQTSAAPGAPEASAQAGTDAAAAQDGGPEIVVLGVRGAQQKAVDIKRNASQIVDSVVAEDIGKLPDTTIADSLQRVPGVQIDRSAGEGSSVNIRGLGQVLVTLNGEQFIGASNIGGAQPNFTDIPPTLFAGVDVYKSAEAKQLPGGISGTIDLRTRRPFDLKHGLSATADLENSYGDRSDSWNNSVSGLIGWHGRGWGLLVAGSYTDETLANTSINTGGSWMASTDTTSGKDLRGDGTVGIPANADPSVYNNPGVGYFALGNYAYQPVVVSMTNQTTQRQRLGLNASGQLELGSAFTLTGDVAYTRLQNHDRDVALQLNSGYAQLPLLAGSQVDKNGVVTVGSYNLSQFIAHSDSTPSTSHALNTNLQLDFNNGGHFKGTLRWVHADARSDLDSSQADAKASQGALVHRGDSAACRSDAPPASCTFNINPGGYTSIPATIDYTAPIPSVAFGVDLTDPSRYDIMSTWAQGDHLTSQLDAYRADGSYSWDNGFLKSLDFGGRYGMRKIGVENYKYLAPVTVPGLGLLDEPSDLYFYKDPQIGHTGRPDIQGLSVLPLVPFSAIPQDIGRYSDFVVPGIPAGGIPAVNPYAMDDPVAFQNSLFPGNEAYVDPANSYRLKQRDVSAYVQANFAGHLGLDFSGNVGLRVVNTRRTIYSNTTNPNDFIGTGGSYNGVAVNLGTTATTRDFTHWLPSANLAIDTFHNQKLRFAYAKVVGDLDLYSLGAGRILYYGANNGRYPDQPSDLQVFQSGSSGNPNLEPYQADNYNVSYEWYFGHGGLLSAAAFLFDVKSFPESVSQIEPIPDQDGVVRAGGVITTYANGKGGTIKGVEVGYQQQFDFLPGFLNGLGMQANYTYSDSGSSNRDLFGKMLPVPDNSKHQFNLVGLYQKSGLQARVAYNWRSKRYAGLVPVSGTSHLYAGDTTPTTDNLAIYSRPIGYLDASVSYDITPTFTVYLQGTNLTRAYDQEYAQFKNLFYSESLYDRRLTFGVRIRN